MTSFRGRRELGAAENLQILQHLNQLAKGRSRHVENRVHCRLSISVLRGEYCLGATRSQAGGEHRAVAVVTRNQDLGDVHGFPFPAK